MHFLIDILIIVLPLLYLSTVCAYGLAFFKYDKLAKGIKTRVLVSTVFMHITYLVVRTIEFEHAPVTTVFEIMTILALAISLVYLYIEFQTKVKETGFFILSIAFVFQLISSMFIRDLVEVKPVLKSWFLGFHVTSALLGYSAIAISAVYGFLYLMLYHEIKSSRFGIIYSRLPSLEILENMSFRSIVFSFILLTVTILVGFIWLPKAFEEFSYADPKLIGTFAIWALYGIGLVTKRLAGWRGRRIMILSLFGFAIALFSMTFINIFLSRFHRFY